jgi:hypothetical protein
MDHVRIEFEGKFYDVKFLPFARLFIFKDVTNNETLFRINKAQSPVVGLLVLDNYQEASPTFDEGNEIILSIRKTINDYAEKYGLLLKKFRNDAYIIFTNDARYILELQTQTGELIHSWQSDNCIYPYFYWIYLYTGTALSIAVDIKNAQVMRNKMIQVLGKTFKPNAWITLRGDQASLAIQLKQLVIDRTIFEHPSIKNKFRQHIDPFLSLIEYDSSRYEKDRMYNEYVFLTVYDEILRRLNHD